MNEPFPLRAYFSHHKCATGWTSNILREVCFHMGLTFRIVNQPDRDLPTESTLPSFVEDRSIDVLAYTNADIHHAADLPLHRGFHVVRDPRDILVSAYFSHKHSHPTDEWPELIAHRDQLQSVSKSEGLLLEMDFSRPFFEDMFSWNYEQDRVLEVRMEDLTQTPSVHFHKIARFLDLIDHNPPRGMRRTVHMLRLKMNRMSYKGAYYLPGPLRPVPLPRLRTASVPPSLLDAILDQHRFERLTGRKRGKENVKSHLRKGVPGDWKNHFTDQHVQVFKEKYNDLLLKLEYETTPNWDQTD